MSKKVFKSIVNAHKVRPKEVGKPLPETIVVSDLSIGTQEVLEYFGLDAPTLLNDYCNALEDALIDSVTVIKELKQKYEALKSKHE